MNMKLTNSLQTLRDERSGAALIIAIGMLFIISMLSIAYLNSMVLDYQRVGVIEASRQAEASAERAVHAAIAEIGALVMNVEDVPESMNFESMALYEAAKEGTEPPSVDETRRAVANIQITDESARLNLNYAPVRLLQAFLGVDGATARAIRGSVPRPGAPPTEDAHFFLHVDELVSRGFMTREELEALPKDQLTVYTARNLTSPRGFININAVSPELLAAICNIDVEAATAVVEKRPFTSFQDFVDAVGKSPAAFNVTPAANQTDGVPPELALYSRCYRIRCEAEVQRTIARAWDRLGADSIEAVVQFDREGRSQVLSWRGLRGNE